MVAFTACKAKSSESTASTEAEPSEQVITNAPAPIQNTDPNIDLATAKKWLQEKKDIVLIDVRTQGEVNNGKIGNPLHIDISQPDFADRIAALDKNKEYIVYCAVGGRSGRAVSQMQKMGFTKAYNLQGGYDQWIR